MQETAPCQCSFGIPFALKVRRFSDSNKSGRFVQHCIQGSRCQRDSCSMMPPSHPAKPLKPARGALGAYKGRNSRMAQALALRTCLAFGASARCWTNHGVRIFGLAHCVATYMWDSGICNSPHGFLLLVIKDIPKRRYSLQTRCDILQLSHPCMDTACTSRMLILSSGQRLLVFHCAYRVPFLHAVHHPASSAPDRNFSQ